jgi:hypothetical protein
LAERILGFGHASVPNFSFSAADPSSYEELFGRIATLVFLASDQETGDQLRDFVETLMGRAEAGYWGSTPREDTRSCVPGR